MTDKEKILDYDYCCEILREALKLTNREPVSLDRMMKIVADHCVEWKQKETEYDAAKLTLQAYLCGRDLGETPYYSNLSKATLPQLIESALKLVPSETADVEVTIKIGANTWSLTS